MNIKRFYTFLPSVEEGGKRIKLVIKDINKAKKDMKYSYATNIKVNLNGSLYTRAIELERIDSIKVVNSELKINFMARVKRDNNHYELIDKDTTIGIPIKMIDSIEVDVIE
ncbi:MAG TPA: hypothetical protein DCR12_04565 [Lachnospiraceae bacterium]|nr:hypothetical protein [Lachnospiraceae bacterium]